MVKMLRTATERYKQSGSGGGKTPSAVAAAASGKAAAAGKKKAAAAADADSDEDGYGDDTPDGAALDTSMTSVASNASGPGTPQPPMTSAELLSVLREAVRMLTEYASILRSQLEDAQERGERA